MSAKKKAALPRKVLATSNCGDRRYEWIQRGDDFGIWDGKRWIDKFASAEEMALRLVELNGLVTSQGDVWLSSREG